MLLKLIQTHGEMVVNHRFGMVMVVPKELKFKVVVQVMEELQLILL
jgi:hypothetical protein